jgi:hypothetical protein
MPQRLNLKSPGEFVRDHILDQPEGVEYVGGMFNAYKDHLRQGGARNLPCRASFGSLVWMLKEVGAMEFVAAQPISFDEDDPDPLPAGYEPGCAFPSPRHYYRVVDPDHPGFDRPRAVWNESRGFPAPAARPRVAAVAEPVVVEEEGPPEERPPRRRRPPLAQRLQEEGLAFRARIQALREDPDVDDLDQLEADMLDWFDRVLDAAESATGPAREMLQALGSRLEAAAEVFGGDDPIRAKLIEGRRPEYLADLDALITCCPSDGS